MICKEIPKTMYCHIGGSGTWGCEFPEDLNMEGITLLKRDMEFETPFGVTACMKLYEMDASITADHKPRQVLYVPFHGWKGALPLQRHSQRAHFLGIKGSRCKIHTGRRQRRAEQILCWSRATSSVPRISLIIQSVYPIWENLRLTACA